MTKTPYDKNNHVHVSRPPSISAGRADPSHPNRDVPRRGGAAHLPVMSVTMAGIGFRGLTASSSELRKRGGVGTGRGVICPSSLSSSSSEEVPSETGGVVQPLTSRGRARNLPAPAAARLSVDSARIPVSDT